MKTLLSAVQPTSQLTLGTYLGAIRSWVETQAQYDCYFFLVDSHAITLRQDPKALREQTYFALAAYLACGVDPKRCTLFVQSHVSEHAELAWVLNCYSYMGELNRMTQFKDKSKKAGENIPVGLFAYPILMAADILLYGTNFVPVGADQKQHVELTRDIAIRFNNLYGNIFSVPEPMIPKVGARIMSLQDPTSKMSKSDPDPNATIFLSDSDDTIVKKLKRAVTDSGSEINDSDDKPGVRNLLTIQAALSGKPVAEIVETYKGKQYGHLKVDTGDQVVAALKPIREKILETMKDKSSLDKIFQKGAERARSRARETLTEVYDAVGFVPGRYQVKLDG